MSIAAFAPASPSLIERAHALLALLFASHPSKGRRHRSLKNLPDHLLLDIGIDPRNVPTNTEQEIARPDMAHRGLTGLVFRTVAKS